MGAGALGLFLASRMIKGGLEPQLFDIDEEKVNRLQEKGLTVAFCGYEEKFKVQASADKARLHLCDIVIVTVKSYQTKEALANIANVLRPETIILTMQNGLTNIEVLKEFTEKSNIVAGVTTIGVAFGPEGKLFYNGGEEIVIGFPFGGDDSGLKELCDVFAKGGFPIQVTKEILSALWTKAIVNSVINPLTALSCLNNGELLQDSEMLYIMEHLVAEGETLAKEEGIALRSDDMLSFVKNVCRITAANTSSMLRDVCEERPTEIEAINGAICKAAYRRGLSVPYNQLMVDLIKKYENLYISPSR